MDQLQAHRRARAAGILLGLGLGGFIDGILLHQILQWHNMLSARVPPSSMDAMRTNMSADGWFHAGVWCLTFSGVLLLWNAARSPVPLPPMRYLLGLLLGGWGVFNLVEGVIDQKHREQHRLWTRWFTASVSCWSSYLQAAYSRLWPTPGSRF